MRTTITLEPEAYRLARALAFQRHTSVGKILSEALLSQFRPTTIPSIEVIMDADGFPTLYLGRPLTSEEVASAIEED